MKQKIAFAGKWILVVLFVLAAGWCYSCGQEKSSVELVRGQEAFPETGAAAAGSGDGGQPETLKGTDRPGAGMQQTEEAPETEAVPEMVCHVHVCGQVERPGVYELAEGQRIYEAIEKAGGFTAEAAEDYLNLAEPVRDGMKIQVPGRDQVPQESWPAGGAGEDPLQQGKVNLNTATKEELMTLQGIGEARAETIIRYRSQRGGFQRIEDIMEVSGIKNAAFEKIKDDITV